MANQNNQKMKNLYEKFSGFEYDNTDDIIDMGDVSKMAYIGKAIAIEYEAQKHSDRKSHVYRHEFENDAFVASNGTVIIIYGDKIKITEKGIEG